MVRCDVLFLNATDESNLTNTSKKVLAYHEETNSSFKVGPHLPGLIEAPKDAMRRRAARSKRRKPRFCRAKADEQGAVCTMLLLHRTVIGVLPKSKEKAYYKMSNNSQIQSVPSSGNLQYVPSGRSLLAVCKRKHQSRRLGK